MNDEDLNYLKDTNWFNKALDHYKNGESAQGLISINFYLVENSYDVDGLIVKAMFHNALANYEEAEKLLNTINLSKNNSLKFLKLFYWELGRLYDNKNELEKAAVCYQKVIEVQPNDTAGYIMKGAVLAKLGQYEEAKKLHIKATKLEGDPDEAFFNLGLILRAELNLEKAREAFEDALELCPNEERIEKELEDVEKAIKLQKEIAAHYLARTKITRILKTDKN